MTDDGLDGWRAVNAGSIPTWRTIVGADDPSWLSLNGKALVEQIVTDFERIIGSRWIADVFGPPRAPAFPTWARMSPLIYLQGPAMGLIALTYTWLSIRSTEGLPGHDKVIKSITVRLPEADGTTLIVAPGTECVGTSLDGPALKVDIGHRLQGLLIKKARQATKCGGSMLWVEDHGAMRLAFSYAKLLPAVKLDALVRLFQPVLDATPGLNAIVYTRRSRTPVDHGPTFDRSVLGESSLILNQPHPGLIQETAIIAKGGGAELTAVENLVGREVDLWLAALREATNINDWDFARLLK